MVNAREYKGQRYNELVFDDTSNEIRATLATEHGKTQLNQGYLIHPRSEGKGSPRGEGFELRTDNAGAIRAAQGLLVTTEAQQHANGKQLDRSPALAQLEAAQNLTQQLGDVAQNQRANKPKTDPALNADQLKSKKPHILMHGHGGAAITTPKSVTLATGKDFNQVSLRDAHQTSGRLWIHNVGESASIFVANAQTKIKTAMKLIAAKGDVLVQAQSNDVEITADKNVKITACKSTLTASAGKEFLLQSGGGYIKISGGNIDIHCPGKLSMKAANFVHIGGGGGSVATPTMPTADYNPIKPGNAGFDNNTFLGGMANGVLNQLAVVTSVGRKDGLTVQPFTGVVVSKPEQQDAKFNNLVGVGGVVSKLGQVASFASKFITAPNKALFWSGLGQGGDKVASEVALKQEKITLEQLIKKNEVDMPNWDAANPKSVKAWQNASKSFAEGSSGQVKVVTGDKMRPGSIWETFELPALKSKAVSSNNCNFIMQRVNRLAAR